MSDAAQIVSTDQLAAWLPQLMEYCVHEGAGEYYAAIVQLVEAQLEREGPGPAKLERRIIGVHEAWYLRRWKMRARTNPAAAKAAREIAAYLRAYRKADDQLAVRTFANVLACYDELPGYLQGRTLLKINKNLVEALAHLKSYHVAPAEAIVDFWRACLSISPEQRKHARLSGQQPGATLDAMGADCFPIGELDTASVQKSMAMLMRGFEQSVGLRIREVREYHSQATWLIKEYPMLLTLDIAYAFAQAARGETKGWNHQQGYNINRILHEFRVATLQGKRR